MIYIGVFIIETILCALIEKTEKNKKIRTLLCVIVVLIISILGGARDKSVGYDVTVYGEWYFYIATMCSNFSTYISNINSEMGYLIINYIVSRFSSDLNIFFFVCQLIINTLFFTTMYRYRKNIPLWLSMFSYLTLYYCRTFDYLRQSFALAIIFFSLRYVEQEKPIKFFICVLIAKLFHNSAIIAIFFYFANIIMNNEKNKIKKIMFIYIIISSTILSVICFPDIMEFLYNRNLLSERYYEYTTVYAKKNVDINFLDTFFRLILILLYVIQAKKLNSKFKLNPLFGLLIIMDLIVYQIKNTIRMADRFAFYFGIMDILIIPQYYKIGKDKKNQILINILLVLMLFVFWYYKFVIKGYASIYPYTSSILGI